MQKIKKQALIHPERWLTQGVSISILMGFLVSALSGLAGWLSHRKKYLQ